MQLLGLTFELCTIALTEISQRPGPSMHLLPLELDPHLFVGIESLVDKASFAQCIFVDPAILHNHRKVLVRVFDELDIF